MLAMIGDFKFQMTKKEFEQMTHEITWNWAETKRIGNHPKKQAVGKSNETISFTGTLKVQSIYSFDDFEEIAEKQEPVTFSSVNGSFMVVIHSIKKDKQRFLKTGEYLEQGFTIAISRFYE